MSDNEMPYRVVVYKDGSPSSKFLFSSREEAVDYATIMRLKFLKKIKEGKNSFNSPALHYVAEGNY